MTGQSYIVDDKDRKIFMLDRIAYVSEEILTQEMNREANTVGSKANDIEVSRASVALKEEIERIREQVENVE